MWIEIHKDIFEKSEFDGLDYLFRILSWYPQHSIKRYNIFIDLEKIKSTENYSKFKLIQKDFDLFIDQQFNDFITESQNKNLKDYSVAIENRRNHPKIFNIEEAIRFFKQPVSIILENNKNDAYFIKAIIHHFDSFGKVIEHLKNGWIKFENAGGCSNVANFIEGELKIFEDLALRNKKETFDYFRGMIILDSDKESMEQPIKTQYLNLESYLNSKKINQDRYHFLEKRMMENYMPDEVFEEIEHELTRRDKKLKSWIISYKQLDSARKDFLKYFEDMGSEFKTSFPKRFESANVNKYTLKARANSDELERILNKISQLL